MLTGLQFLKNNRGINDKQDLPEQVLIDVSLLCTLGTSVIVQIYQNIVNNEIKLRDDLLAQDSAVPVGHTEINWDDLLQRSGSVQYVSTPVLLDACQLRAVGVRCSLPARTVCSGVGPSAVVVDRRFGDHNESKGAWDAASFSSSISAGSRPHAGKPGVFGRPRTACRARGRAQPDRCVHAQLHDKVCGAESRGRQVASGSDYCAQTANHSDRLAEDHPSAHRSAAAGLGQPDRLRADRSLAVCAASHRRSLP